MAAKKANATAGILDDQLYRVELKEKVEVGGRTFYPGRRLQFKGHILRPLVDEGKITSWSAN